MVCKKQVFIIIMLLCTVLSWGQIPMNFTAPIDDKSDFNDLSDYLFKKHASKSLSKVNHKDMKKFLSLAIFTRLNNPDEYYFYTIRVGNKAKPLKLKKKPDTLVLPPKPFSVESFLLDRECYETIDVPFRKYYLYDLFFEPYIFV